jgi:intracellular sulfur oxidation DsrE/DsrF family protein
MPQNFDHVHVSVLHHVVWQVVDDGPVMHERLLRQVANLLADLGAEGVEVEVVAHGAGLDLLLPGGPAAELVRDLQCRGVAFLACENTLRSRELEVGDLLADVGAVPSGVGAIVRRQSQGWSYLRA